MRPDSQQRRRSRGGRRHRNSDYEPVPRTAPAPKQSFFQKLISMFTGGSSQAKSTTNGSAQDNSRRNQQPQPQSQSSKSDRYERSERPERGERSERPERSERQSRKPEIVEVSSPKLYVGNLSFDASESDLFELFNGVGKVQNAEIVSNKYTQKSKGFAFVTLQTIDEARRAVTELHDKEFMGRKLVVSGAKTSDTARSGGSNDNGDSHAGDESSSDSGEH